MSAKQLPWFRLYTEIIDDEKLGLLAFEDRWHFISILCLKGKGLLDSEQDHEMLMRKVAFKMGLTCGELENVALRLSRMGLIDRDTLQPIAWGARQMQSDSSAERVKAFRERTKQAERYSNVTVTAQELDTDTDTEEDKYKDKDLSPTAPSPPETKITHDVLFETFWKAYPKKEAKGAAEKAWAKIRDKGKTLPLILEALHWQTSSESWAQGNGQYIPHPATYLNAKRWLDEKPVVTNEVKHEQNRPVNQRKPSLCERATLARQATERRLKEREAYGERVGEDDSYLRQ